MYQRSTREKPETAAPTATVGAIALRRVRPMNFGVVVAMSFLLHGLFIGLVALTLFILQFLGFDLFAFDPLVLKDRDIEFVLVENPEQQPRNPTKNRSDRATRAGGEKIPNQKEAEPQRRAGQPKQAQPQPRPQPQVAQQRPQPKPAPRPQPQQRPSPQPPKQVTQAPPQPKLPTPTKAPSKTPSLPPNPVAPTIKTPAPPTPKLAHAGPVMSSSSSSSGSGTSGRPSPSQIPGSTSGGSRTASASPSGGASAGSGGSSSYNQSGSPGGGPGRPGIDALPEPDYGAYMAELQRRIKRNWRPPSAQEDKRVVVLFRIARDGRLLSLDVNNSSGYPEADQAAMAAVKLSAPFRPLPAGHKDTDLAVQFTFDYNVYKNRGGGGITSYR